MKHITCPLTYIPIRKEPSHKSEQDSQLIFGETANIIEESGEWLHIETRFDNYIGWVERKTVKEIAHPEEEFDITGGFHRLVKTDNNSLWVSTGSELHSGRINSKEEFLIKINPELDEKNILTLAEQFLGSPYLWGGRTFMGIDCSGLIQVLYKAIGIPLPRNASQQVSEGQTVPFIEQAQPGDLAFFDNEEGEINHVGLIYNQSLILHASGSVRIDKIDHQGIFNSHLDKYTHKLRVVKRVQSSK